MAHGDTADTDGAAARLHELSTYFRQHPVAGPAGHSYISSEPRATSVAPTLPFNASVTDHITSCVREVAEHTRAANPDAGPLPQRVQDAYAWMHASLEHAPERDRLRAEVLEYRQWLEHCLHTGDHETVRRQVPPQPCPECRCWGLMWSREMGLVVCTNPACFDREGFSTKLSLARFAHLRVAAEQKLRQSRAT